MSAIKWLAEYHYNTCSKCYKESLTLFSQMEKKKKNIVTSTRQNSSFTISICWTTNQLLLA